MRQCWTYSNLLLHIPSTTHPSNTPKNFCDDQFNTGDLIPSSRSHSSLIPHFATCPKLGTSNKFLPSIKPSFTWSYCSAYWYKKKCNSFCSSSRIKSILKQMKWEKGNLLLIMTISSWQWAIFCAVLRTYATNTYIKLIWKMKMIKYGVMLLYMNIRTCVRKFVQIRPSKVTYLHFALNTTYWALPLLITKMLL